jgi:uncharacterized protein (DUF433 family)
MNRNETVIHRDPEIMGGTPVFVGTQVPLATLLDYLEAGQPLAEFLEDFPTVTREQAVAALEQAKDRNLSYQQDPSSVDIAIVVLVARSNRLDDLRPLVPRVLQMPPAAKRRTVTIVGRSIVRGT